MLYNKPKIVKKWGDVVDGNCDKTEGARLLETMRRICAATGCEEVEHATLAYEEVLQEADLQIRNQCEAT